MKVLFHLKNGQRNELLLNLIFPDYPDGNAESGGTEENSAKEKETENSVSLSSGCSYTPVMVPVMRLPVPPYRHKFTEIVYHAQSHLSIADAD